MSKNKGGREVRKPKQAKKPKAADTAVQPLNVARAGKPPAAKTGR